MQTLGCTEGGVFQDFNRVTPAVSIPYPQGKQVALQSGSQSRMQEHPVSITVKAGGQAHVENILVGVRSEDHAVKDGLGSSTGRQWRRGPDP